MVSGSPSQPLILAVGSTAISVQVTAEDASVTRTYTLTVTRLPAAFVYQAAGDTPVSVPNFAAGGNAPGFVLAYAPTVGTNLTVINNTGNALIQGVFANLAQGQQVGVQHVPGADLLFDHVEAGFGYVDG